MTQLKFVRETTGGVLVIIPITEHRIIARYERESPCRMNRVLYHGDIYLSFRDGVWSRESGSIYLRRVDGEEVNWRGVPSPGGRLLAHMESEAKDWIVANPAELWVGGMEFRKLCINNAARKVLDKEKELNEAKVEHQKCVAELGEYLKTAPHMWK